MTCPKINNKAPIFKGIIAENTSIGLKDFAGKQVVLYFYPKDNTSGCSQQAQDFRDAQAKFKRANTVVIGVSRDSLKSHKNFKDKFALNFDLISDADEALCQQYDVMKEKSMYGKKYMGIERSTFLIDASGKLKQEWRKVKVAGHVDEVLEAAKLLNKAS